MSIFTNIGQPPLDVEAVEAPDDFAYDELEYPPETIEKPKQRIVRAYHVGSRPPYPGHWWIQEYKRDQAYNGLLTGSGLYTHLKYSLEEWADGTNEWSQEEYTPHDEFTEWYGITWVKEREENEFGPVSP